MKDLDITPRVASPARLFASIFAGIAALALLPTLLTAQTNWQRVALQGMGVADMTIAPNGRIYSVGAAGINYSTDKGLTWPSTSILDPGTAIAATSTGKIIVVLSSSMARSTNGTSWTEIAPPAQVYVKALAADAEGHLFVGATNGVYRSDDDGTTWDKLSGSGLPQTNPDPAIFAAGTEGNLFTGTVGIVGGNVYHSTNAGNSWTKIYTGTVNNDITALGVAPNGRIFAGIAGKANIMYSDNLGENWNEASGPNVASRRVFSFAFSQNGIFAGTGNGVLRSTDGGGTWSDFNAGLPNNTPATVVRALPDGVLIAGTIDGIYRYEEVIASVEETEEARTALNVSPNPAVDRAAIGFSLAITSHVRLTIADELGREVATIVDETRAPGSHSAVWETENVSAGTYFVRIVTGDAVTTRRVVVAR